MKSSSAMIGAFEAKTKLGELLERVSHGGEFTITKHDRPVARLIGFETVERRGLAVNWQLNANFPY